MQKDQIFNKNNTLNKKKTKRNKEWTESNEIHWKRRYTIKSGSIYRIRTGRCWRSARRILGRWETFALRLPIRTVRTSSRRVSSTLGTGTPSTRIPETRCALGSTRRRTQEREEQIQTIVAQYICFGHIMEKQRPKKYNKNQKHNIRHTYTVDVRAMRLSHAHHSESAAERIGELLNVNTGRSVECGVPRLGRLRTIDV